MVSQASSAVSAYLTGEAPADEARVVSSKSSFARNKWSRLLMETARAAEEDGESELSAQLIDLAESRGTR